MKLWKRGDTLIEVAIAIAIFSLVAIGVVGVVNTSTSAAQSALEVTLTREEIDAQAEALRFIHNSYIAGGKANAANNDKYKELWGEITGQAINVNDNGLLNAVTNYFPSTCAELYTNDLNNNNTIYVQKAFIINTRTLRPESVDNKFTTAATYPRLIYSDANDGALLDESDNGVLSRVEGIYIVAVPDAKTTTIVGTTRPVSAFYDFYIRTCWFAPGAERPSTISTVIRLQDPEMVLYNQ
ncbi:prepilin-type N-terminal cleavage/methylation domain-containing protein [Candidatus Saccharibacteria bacterium]|nr:prepilin-type N-terminal cleavage/methylation domain-containing protein [Candidatus Saccharibacteria bacterium]